MSGFQRKRMLAGLLAVAMVATLTLGAGPAPANERTSTTAGAGLVAADPAQDGKDLFRGVFFLTGPQAAVVAVAVRAPDEVLARNRSAEVEAFLDALVTKVDELDPAFFASFAGQLRSGDPFQVEQAMAAARQLILRASEDMGAEIEQPDPGLQSPTFWVAVAAIITVLTLLNVAVSVNAVYVEGGPQRVGVAPSFPWEEGLTHEQAVAALTEAFAS